MYFQKDIGGQTKRVLLGRFPSISADTARHTALDLTLEMGRRAGKVHLIRAPNLGEALSSYLACPKIRSSTYKHALKMQFDNHLKDWLKLPLDEITKAMVLHRHKELSCTPSAANHVLRQFKSVWNHARRVHDQPESPALAVEWYEEQPEGTIIEDLAAWQRGIDKIENPIHRVFYELLLFIGLRKTEAATLQWKHVLEDRIHLPQTKNGRSFDLPILQLHHEILAPLRNLNRDWVFPSAKSVQGHITNPSRTEWSPHAHRRTFATVAMEAGVLEDLVGRLLNHTPLSITGQRYVKPSLDALRPSMEIACEELTKRTSGK